MFNLAPPSETFEIFLQWQYTVELTTWKQFYGSTVKQHIKYNFAIRKQYSIAVTKKCKTSNLHLKRNCILEKQYTFVCQIICKDISKKHLAP